MIAFILLILGIAISAYFAIKRYNKKIAMAVAIIIVVLGYIWIYNLISNISDI